MHRAQHLSSSLYAGCANSGSSFVTHDKDAPMKCFRRVCINSRLLPFHTLVHGVAIMPSRKFPNRLHHLSKHALQNSSCTYTHLLQHAYSRLPQRTSFMTQSSSAACLALVEGRADRSVAEVRHYSHLLVSRIHGICARVSQVHLPHTTTGHITCNDEMERTRT